MLEYLQVPVTLVEYSMNAVAEGIDAIATTRVLIRGDEAATINGVAVNRTFRYVVLASEVRETHTICTSTLTLSFTSTL